MHIPKIHENSLNIRTPGCLQSRVKHETIAQQIVTLILNAFARVPPPAIDLILAGCNSVELLPHIRKAALKGLRGNTSSEEAIEEAIEYVDKVRVVATTEVFPAGCTIMLLAPRGQRDPPPGPYGPL